jgi:hypothetical protein
MKGYLLLHRLGLLAAFLFFGTTSALRAQTNTNSDGTNSKLGASTPEANRVLLQNSSVGHSIIHDPEMILGHRLLHKVGTHNAAAQKANEIQSNSIGKISSSAPNRVGVTHRFFITDLGTLGGAESFAYAIMIWGKLLDCRRQRAMWQSTPFSTAMAE